MRKSVKTILIVLAVLTVLGIGLGVLGWVLMERHTYYFEEDDSMQKDDWAWVELSFGTWRADTGETGTYTEGDIFLYFRKEDEEEHFALGICEDGELWIYYIDNGRMRSARTKKAGKREEG